ncbi:glycosyltransferase family 1 protein [Candidatus Heimdallarchaeota archaeon]|nr:MAG: glycosyltransferase family 1 protein [Candidatus Heimdallarchaeota archaeon]
MNTKTACILTQEYERGATWIYSEEIAKAIKNLSDWNPILVTALKDEKLTQKPKKSETEIKFIRTGSSKLFYSNKYWKGTSPIIESIKPDLIHGNLPMLSTRNLSTKIPIIETVHTTFYGEQQSIIGNTSEKLNWVERRLLLTYPVLKRIEAKLMKQAKHLIAVSDPIKQEIVNYYRVPSSKITVVPNGVDTRKYKKTDEKIYEKNENEFVLGFLGRMMIRKGSELLVPILRMVRTKYPNVKLMVAGDDLNKKKDFIRTLKKYNLLDSVINLGYINDDMKNSFFSSVDLFLLPSNYEGMNLTLLEALSCQTPILATPEAVTFEHDNTIFTSERSASEFARKIIEIIQNEKLLSEVAKKSRDIADKYSWDNTAKQTLEVYNKVL